MPPLGSYVGGRYVIPFIDDDSWPHRGKRNDFFDDIMPLRPYPNAQKHYKNSYCSICDCRYTKMDGDPEWKQWTMKDIHGYCDYAPVRYQVPIRFIPYFSHRERILRGMRPHEDPRSYPMLFAIALLRRKGLLSI